jgi:hypothetical protein
MEERWTAAVTAAAPSTQPSDTVPPTHSTPRPALPSLPCTLQNLASLDLSDNLLGGASDGFAGGGGSSRELQAMTFDAVTQLGATFKTNGGADCPVTS